MKMSLKSFNFRGCLSQNRMYSRNRARLRRERLCVECLEDRLVLAAPVAVDDTFQAVEGQMLVVAASGVLANDVDADGDTLSATLGSDPLNGSLVFGEDGSFSYTPDPGFVGTDTFTYRAIAQSAIPFTIDPSRSSVNMNIDLVTDFGNDSDSDDSRISGTATVRLDPTSAPFENIQITQLDMSLIDGIDLDFCLLGADPVCLAGVKATAEPGNLTLEMESPGPETTVDPTGAFTQTGNSLRVTGTVNLKGTGLADGQFPEGDTPFDTAGVITPFEGTITQSGQTLTLTIPISVVDVFDLDGQGTADVDVQGTVVATAPVPATESNLATVTIVTTATGLPADFDDSLTVDRADLAILSANYGRTSGATKATGDTNFDGRVNLFDLANLGRGFGESLPPTAPAAADALTQQIAGFDLLGSLQRGERTRSVVATRRVRIASAVRGGLDAVAVDHIVSTRELSSRASRTVSAAMKLRGRGGRLQVQAIDARLSGN